MLMIDDMKTMDFLIFVREHIIFYIFRGIFGKNLKDWKYAERCWLENGNDYKIKFTGPQLIEIKST
jgi:hypothetical protein